MAVEFLGTGNDDGTVMGHSDDHKIAFYAETPVAQQACTVAAALTAGETTPEDIAAAFVEVRNALVALGLISNS